jgi:hypothetical protein
VLLNHHNSHPTVIMPPSHGCEHKIVTCCILTSPTCCACLDKRPVATAYPAYIDGVGMRLRGRRFDQYVREDSERFSADFDSYCWRCRDFWRADARSAQAAQTTSTSNPTWSFTSPAQAGSGHAHPLHTTETPLTYPNTINITPNSDHEPIADVVSRRVSEIRGIQAQNPPHHSDPDIAERRRRRRERPNPFGTREEWESDQYESPIAGVFTRAWTRYRDMEAARRRQEEDEENQLVDQLVRAELGTAPAPVAEIPAVIMPPGPPSRSVSLLERHSVNPLAEAAPRPNPIDIQVGRPPPLKPDDMTVNIACRICYEQKSDTLLMPCYHLALCRWCTDIVRAQGRLEAARQPRRGEGWRCPTCRKAVEGTKRVYLG